jgi:metallo-beta-lactamase class B
LLATHHTGDGFDAVIIGSPKVNAGFIPVSNKKYPQIAEDYVRCFDVLHQLPANFFLGAHGGYFGLKEKFAAMKPGGPNPFIDQAGSTTYVATKAAAFRQEWERQKLNLGSPTPS